MNERILLAPGANPSELLRTLAKYGKNTIGLRIMGSAELAKTALMRSGVSVEEEYISQKEAAALIDCYIRDTDYFASASFADSENVAAALDTLRSLVPENEGDFLHGEFPTGEFPEKNAALCALYDRYTAALKAEKRIDRIGLIRLAIEKEAKIGTDIYTLREFPLSPLDEKLALAVSGKQPVAITLPELFGKEENAAYDVDFTKGYGASNEVEHIIGYILKNNIPFDHCTVAAADPAAYSQLFYEYASRLGFDAVFGCGIPITNSDPARLLKLYNVWNTSGYNGAQALKNLLLSPAFDRKKLLAALGMEEGFSRHALADLAEKAGGLRISCSRESNRQRLENYEKQNGEDADVIGKLAAELEKGCKYFIETYSVIRDRFNGRIDRSAVKVITREIDAFLKFAPDARADDIIPAILTDTVCSENSREGALYVTGIGGALCAPREHLFIAGLSANAFPGSPAENYLLADSDLHMLSEYGRVPASDEKIRMKKQTLEQLVSLASALGVHVHFSYPFYSLADIKDRNPSSALFEIYSRRFGSASSDDFEKAVVEAGFFEEPLSDAVPVGKAAAEGRELLFTPPVPEEAPVVIPGDKRLSPSALDTFFACPRKFFLKHILALPEAETEDPFEVIAANEAGSLAHSLMEELAKRGMSEEEFLTLSENAFDAFLMQKIPVNPDDAVKERDRFVRMMQNAYETDPGNHVETAEEEFSAAHPSGVLLHGKPDRIEKTAAGEYIIVDYKTGASVRHAENDIDTCLQAVIYAYFAEQAGLPVTRCEYRYLRSRKTVGCVYDEDMKNRLNDKLTQFKEAAQSGEYPCTVTKNCQYCAYYGLCGNGAGKEGASDDE